MSAITAKASRKMKKYAVLTREPRCFLGSFDFSWEQRKLGDIADIVGGGTPSTGNQSYWDGDIDWYAPAEIADQIYANSSQKKITGLGYENSSAKMLPPGTVLFTSRAGIGKTAILTRKGCTNQGFQSIVPHRGELDSYFIFSRTEELKRYGELVGAGSTFVEVSGKQMAVMELMMPPTMREQQTIGGFFQQLDNLITLHQRKCVFLFGFFQAFISMIFTASTFSWEQRKLGDVVKEITRNDPGSEAPIMMITANNGFIEQSERYAFNNAGESLKKYILLKKGELAYNHGASKLRPYGSCFALTTAENARIPFVYHCFSAENQNAEFMSIELNGAEIENQLRKIVSSGARMDGLLNISFDEYTSVSVILPGTEEQDRIADFFRHLDNLITLHQRECISFTARAGRLILTANKKRNTSSWEQRKLGELVDRVVRKNINNESTLPLTISAQYGLVDQITYFNNRVASRDVSNYYLVLNGEFAYNKSTSDGYPFGAVKRLDLYEKGVLSTLYIVFAPKKEQQIDSDYLTVFFDTDRWHKGVAERAAEGARNHGLLNISAEDFFDIDLSVPKDIVEQKQIGAFIRQLDNLITLHQRELEKLQNIKKSMLEKMFV